MIEIDIIVRKRNEKGRPIGSPGHETLQFKLLDKLPFKDRKRMAVRLADYARELLSDLNP